MAERPSDDALAARRFVSLEDQLEQLNGHAPARTADATADQAALLDARWHGTQPLPAAADRHSDIGPAARARAMAAYRKSAPGPDPAEEQTDAAGEQPAEPAAETALPPDGAAPAEGAENPHEAQTDSNE